MTDQDDDGYEPCEETTAAVAYQVIGQLALRLGYFHDGVPQDEPPIGMDDLTRALDWFSDPDLRAKGDLVPWPSTGKDR
jgi:hypothetical protein